MLHYYYTTTTRRCIFIIIVIRYDYIVACHGDYILIRCLVGLQPLWLIGLTWLMMRTRWIACDCSICASKPYTILMCGRAACIVCLNFLQEIRFFGFYKHFSYGVMLWLGDGLPDLVRLNMDVPWKFCFCDSFILIFLWLI